MSALNKNVLVVGISGATCSGKSTTAYELNKILPGSKIFCQDDYFFEVNDPRHTWISELNHINFDILSSLDMDKMTREIKEYIGKRCNTFSQINDLELTNGHEINGCKGHIQKMEATQPHIVVVEGFCIFNHKPLSDLCSLKYYFTLDKEECFKRRTQRVYDPPDCPGYFEGYVWPEHLKQMEEVRQNVQNVTYFNGKSINIIEKILNDIKNF